MGGSKKIFGADSVFLRGSDESFHPYVSYQCFSQRFREYGIGTDVYGRLLLLKKMGPAKLNGRKFLSTSDL